MYKNISIYMYEDVWRNQVMAKPKKSPRPINVLLCFTYLPNLFSPAEVSQATLKHYTISITSCLMVSDGYFPGRTADLLRINKQAYIIRFEMNYGVVWYFKNQMNLPLQSNVWSSMRVIKIPVSFDPEYKTHSKLAGQMSAV